MLIVGNKVDKVAERAVSPEEGKQLAKELGADFCETSAKSGHNIQTMIVSAVSVSISLQIWWLC